MLTLQSSACERCSFILSIAHLAWLMTAYRTLGRVEQSSGGSRIDGAEKSGGMIHP